MKNNIATLSSCVFLGIAASTIVVAAPTADDFATGNMEAAVKAMDANADGMLSKDEYVAFMAADYDKNAAQVATGNMTDAVKAEHATKRSAFMKAQDAKYATMTKGSNGQVTAKDMTSYLKGPASK